MKKILHFALIALFFVSCSPDDCSENRADIIAYYDKMIKLAGDNDRQISYLIKERDKKLQNACK